MKYTVELADTTVEVEIDNGRVLLNGRAQDVRLTGRPGDPVRRLVRGRASRSFVATPGESRSWLLSVDGTCLQALVLDPRERMVRQAAARSRTAAGTGTLKAPMPGLVLRVLVEEGSEVTAGQGLVVIEAMKMENELKAAGPGVVGRIHVAAGERVEKGVLLVEMK